MVGRGYTLIRYSSRRLLNTRPSLRHPYCYGGSDAEPRWFLPRRSPRPGQRGVHSSGWLVARFFMPRGRKRGVRQHGSEENVDDRPP